MTLSPEIASRFANIVLAGIQREFPNKLDHVINSAAEVQSPRALHPAFCGCFDWHSCVHGHWLLARILRLVPGLPEAPQIRAALSATLTPANIAAEVAYLARPNSGSFERTYGWAWLLKLAEELGLAADRTPRRCSEALQPLADAFVARYLAHLPKADYPIRAGTHPNSAFGLAFAHDYVRSSQHSALRERVESKARAWFAGDQDYPAHLEPSGADFFSPALMEADLMRRILAPAAFADWFDRFLPSASDSRPPSLFTPAIVCDRADLHIVHLDGLNLSRAWNLRGIAAALPSGHPARHALVSAAELHASAALPHVTSGHYAGEHWLATFAMLCLTGE